MARKTKGLKQRDTFVIFTNGKETEKNYFTELRDYRHSIYDIKIKFESADPKGLLLRAIKELKTGIEVLEKQISQADTTTINIQNP